MESIIKELWHGNIIPQENSRTNSKEMKELLGYMVRHHEDLEKTLTDEQKEIFEKFHDCWSEYASLGECAHNQAKQVCKLACKRVSADCSAVVRILRT